MWASPAVGQVGAEQTPHLSHVNKGGEQLNRNWEQRPMHWSTGLANPGGSDGIPMLKALQNGFRRKISQMLVKLAGSEDCPAQTTLPALHL